MAIREIQPPLPLSAANGGTGLVSPTGLLVGGASGANAMGTVNPTGFAEVPTYNSASGWSNKAWGEIINFTPMGYLTSATSPGGANVSGTISHAFNVLDANSTILVQCCGLGESVNTNGVRLFIQIDSGSIVCFQSLSGLLNNVNTTSALFSFQYTHNAGQLSVGSHTAKLLFQPAGGTGTPTTTITYPSIIVFEIGSDTY
jgi:hypothetical protein